MCPAKQMVFGKDGIDLINVTIGGVGGGGVFVLFLLMETSSLAILLSLIWKEMAAGSKESVIRL